MNGTPASGHEFRVMPVNSYEKKTILVVDDDPAVRSLIVEALRQGGDYIATEAADG